MAIKKLNRMLVSREGEILAYMRNNGRADVRGDVARWYGPKPIGEPSYLSQKDIEDISTSPDTYSAICSYKNKGVEIWDCDFPTPLKHDMHRVFPPEMFLISEEVEAETAGEAIDLICSNPEIVRTVGRIASSHPFRQDEIIGELRHYAAFLQREDERKAKRNRDEIITPDHIKDAARVAHEVNRAYCEAHGDTSQKPWDNAPSWQRESAIAGVTFIVKNPDVTPRQSHESWMAHKLKDGWTHGPVKDEKTKQHPCMVEYDLLPVEDRAKDYLFAGVVRAVLEINHPQTETVPLVGAIH